MVERLKFECPVERQPVSVEVIDLWDDGMELRCVECGEVWTEEIGN